MPREIGQRPDLDEVRSRLAIHEVLVTHSRGLDRADTATLRSAYWPEAEVDYGSFKGAALEFVDMVGPVLQEKYASTQHKISTTTIEIEGAHARTETYVTAHHLFIDAPRELIFHGRYLDRLEERDGVWKVLHRRVVMDWHRIVDVSVDANDEVLSLLTKGRHVSDDASFAHFGTD
jgi:hypothetical protein